MGSDAFVYCDCFERGRLRKNPSDTWGVYVDESGFRSAGTTDLAQQWVFDQWDFDACEHESGVLLHHRSGNIAQIGLFRRVLQPIAPAMPIIWNKVIYSGSHGGDYLSVEEVRELGKELPVLRAHYVPNPSDREFLQTFERQLTKLVAASANVGKPTVF
jgi:hypothetical protein